MNPPLHGAGIAAGSGPGTTTGLTKERPEFLSCGMEGHVPSGGRQGESSWGEGIDFASGMARVLQRLDFCLAIPL